MRVKTVQQVDAKKTKLTRQDAYDLVCQVNRIYLVHGKRVVHWDLTRYDFDRESLAYALLGPTGNLRAPTLRVGKTLIVGFDEATYRKLLRT